MKVNLSRLIAAAGIFLFASVTSSVGAAEACGPNTTQPTIAGIYVDNYGSLQIIGTTTWVSGGSLTFNICSATNTTPTGSTIPTEGTIIAQNAATNQYNPNKFSQFNWYIDTNSATWYCQVSYNAESQAAAGAVSFAGTSNPALYGCGSDSFPWTQLEYQLSTQN